MTAAVRPWPLASMQARWVRLALVTMSLLATTVAAAPLPHAGEACAVLGDRLNGRRDTDSFYIAGHAGERVSLTLVERPEARNHGQAVRLVLPDGFRRTAGDTRSGTLPLDVAGTLLRDGGFRITVRALAAAGRRFEGAYCLRVGSSDGAASTLEAGLDVEVPWVALAADRGSVFPPFTPLDHGAWGGLIQPVVPLLGSRVYGVIVTTRVRGLDGRPLEADAAFRALAGTSARETGGPIALFTADPEDARNPYPEARLVRPDGRIHVPNRIALRGLDPAAPALAKARARLRLAADQLEELTGFSTISPIEIALSRGADLATVTPANVLVFQRTDGRLDTGGLLAEARRHGVRRQDVALAVSFPTQAIEEDLRGIHARLVGLAAGSSFGAILDDPNPLDGLPLGVFRAADASPFQPFLAANPQVAKVVAGLLPSRNFRDGRGLLDPARIYGPASPEGAFLDFLLTIPARTPPPWRVVIFQHGFGGSNQAVLGQGALLASKGLAVIGISSVSHGRRGSPIDLLTGSPLQVRDIFRQTNADQMALVRMLEAGVDIDHDGIPDLDAREVGYLGISLGGLQGGPFAAVEDRIHAAALVVMSGRIALNGLSPSTRAIYINYLSSQVGLDPDSAEFGTFLARYLDLGQHASNPADSLNFARRWRMLPFPGLAPRNVLMQEGVGDAMVFNVLTEELAMVAGLPSNVPQSDPAGVSGHWIFQPPGGHDISARADVRDQSAAFLDSGGTEIIDPAQP